MSICKHWMILESIHLCAQMLFFDKPLHFMTTICFSWYQLWWHVHEPSPFLLSGQNGIDKPDSINNSGGGDQVDVEDEGVPFPATLKLPAPQVCH